MRKEQVFVDSPAVMPAGPAGGWEEHLPVHLALLRGPACVGFVALRIRPPTQHPLLLEPVSQDRCWSGEH